MERKNWSDQAADRGEVNGTAEERGGGSLCEAHGVLGGTEAGVGGLVRAKVFGHVAVSSAHPSQTA